MRSFGAKDGCLSSPISLLLGTGVSPRRNISHPFCFLISLSALFSLPFHVQYWGIEALGSLCAGEHLPDSRRPAIAEIEDFGAAVAAILHSMQVHGISAGIARGKHLDPFA